ncbi:hypothetical protein SCUP515_07117 [Seiridium cupressi]
MADLSWFSFRARSRPPGLPRSPPPPPPPSNRVGNQETDDHRRSKPNRVSSYINLSSRFSFSPEPVTSSSRESIHVNDEDKVWYNPSMGQMVEALQVIMMTNGVLHPIPVEHNSYILHLIEGLHDMQVKIDAANAACEEARESHSQVSRDFQTVTNEWAKREAQYKAEVKRLEVILARTSRDGLETVTLARTNSVVDRGEPDPRQFVDRLQQLRGQEVRLGRISSPGGADEYNAFLGQAPSTDTNVMGTLRRIENSELTAKERDSRLYSHLPSTLGKEGDFISSLTPRKKRTMTVSKVQHQPRLQTRHSSTAIEGNSAEERPTLEAKLGTKNQDRSHQRLDFASTSSSSDSDDVCRVHEQCYVTDQQPYWTDDDSSYMTSMNDSVLPGPRIISRCQEDGTSVTRLDRAQARGCNVTTDNRFSFIPGDDTSFPANSGQGSHQGPGHEARELGTRGMMYTDGQARLRQQYDKLGQRDDHPGPCLGIVAAAVSGVETPSASEASHGTPSGIRPSLRSSDSAGSVETAINAAEGDGDLRTKDLTHSSGTCTRERGISGESLGLVVEAQTSWTFTQEWVMGRTKSTTSFLLPILVPPGRPTQFSRTYTWKTKAVWYLGTSYSAKSHELRLRTAKSRTGRQAVVNSEEGVSIPLKQLDEAQEHFSRDRSKGTRVLVWVKHVQSQEAGVHNPSPKVLISTKKPNAA